MYSVGILPSAFAYKKYIVIDFPFWFYFENGDPKTTNGRYRCFVNACVPEQSWGIFSHKNVRIKQQQHADVKDESPSYVNRYTNIVSQQPYHLNMPSWCAVTRNIFIRIFLFWPTFFFLPLKNIVVYKLYTQVNLATHMTKYESYV